MIRVNSLTIKVNYLIKVSYPNDFSNFPLSQPQIKPYNLQILVGGTP